MTETVGDIAVRVGMDTAPLQRDGKKANRVLSGLGREARASATHLAKIATAAAAAGAALLAGLVNRGREAIDAQAKLAKQLNTTVASMATLERAGQLSGVSMKQIETASRSLSVRLGEAKDGSGEAAGALQRLKLNADDLIRLPLDQRLATINRALRDNVDVTGRAAVAADLFGARNATAMQQLDAGVLAEAARQAEIFGTAISQVDAARIEMANDAFSTFGVAADGISKQLAIQVAPILKAVGDRFLAAADEAGGLGKVATHVFNGMVEAAGFVADAIESIKRIFNSVANLLVAGFARLTGAWAKNIRDLMAIADKIPGVDLSKQIASVDDFAERSQQIVASAMAAIREDINTPLPSEGFKKWVGEVTEAADAAARKVAETARPLAIPDIENGTGEKGQDEDKRFAGRLERIRAQYLTEQELLRQHLQNLDDITTAFEDGQIATREEYEAIREQAIRDHNQRVEQLRKDSQARQNKLTAVGMAGMGNTIGNALSNLTSVMDEHNKKSFESKKKASLATAAVSLPSAVLQSFENAGGYPWGLVPAGLMGAAGLKQISAIRKQSFGGGASAAADAGAVSSGGSAGTGASAGASSSEANENRTLFVQGLGIGSFLDGEGMRSLVEGINGFLGNGGQLGRVVYV